jgi:hypothetical protein
VAFSNQTVQDSIRKFNPENISQGDPCFYLFSGASSGCAIISAEESDDPILGFTDSPVNDLDDIPPGLLALMESWRVSANNSQASTSKPKTKSNIATRGKGEPVFKPVVEPLIKTKWKQRSPYNYYCPVGYPTGCAAIAMSQVIRYYEWPKQGKGSHQYDDSSTPCWDFTYNKPDAESACPGLSIVKYDCGSDSIKIDYENTKYDYFHMPWKIPDNVDGQTHLNENQKWSAALVRHCATAVNMDFWDAGSHPDFGKGGGVGNQSYMMGLDALHEYFRYNGASDKWYYQTGWGKAVRDCLDEFRPVVFYSLNDMHIYLCDGYGYANDKKTILYHFNFGWGGSWDGYYKEGSVKPHDSNYNLTQYVCTNLKPDTEFKILDVVFNVPGFNPMHYGSDEREWENVTSPVFPYGKTPAALGYDKVLRLYPSESVSFNGMSYLLDTIRCHGKETKVTPNMDRFTILSESLPWTDKIELLLKPVEHFTVDGIEYQPLNYHEVKVVDYKVNTPVFPDKVPFNGVYYDITGIDFAAIIKKGRHSTTTAITANYVRELDCNISKFTKLTKVEFNAVQSLPDRAFRGMTALSSVSASSAVSIGSQVFDGCSKLSQVNLPSADTMGDYALRDCTSLKTIALPKLKMMGTGAFKNCCALTSIHLPLAGDVSVSAFEGCAALVSATLPCAGIIKEKAFFNCKKLATLSAASLTSIGKNAFKDCVTVGAMEATALTIVEESAFEGCTELKKVVSEKLSTVGNNAFKGCKQLSSFPFEQIRTIGNHAFDACVLLTKVSTVQYSVSLGEGAFYNCSKLESFSAPSLKDNCVPDNAFYGCTGLKQMSPSAIRYVGANSFYRCGLTHDLTVGEVSSRAFYNVFTNKEGKITVSLYPSCKEIGESAFYGATAIKCIYALVDVPPKCGANAFKGIATDIPVYVPANSIKQYQEAAGWKDFTNFLTISTVIDGVTYSITTSDSATATGCASATVKQTNCCFIGILKDEDRETLNQAFGQQVANILHINLPSCLHILDKISYNSRTFKVKSIAKEAFKKTVDCLSICMGDSVISTQAFAGCTNAKAIVVKTETPPSVSLNSFNFGKNLKNVLLIVPNRAVPNYQKAAVWREFRIIGMGEIESDQFGKAYDANLAHLDQQIKKEIAQWLIHEKYIDRFADVLGLAYGHWRDLPGFFASNLTLANKASEIFKTITTLDGGLEILMPDSIKGRLNGAATSVGSQLLKDGIQSLGTIQLFATKEESLNINQFIKTSDGLVANLIKVDRPELKEGLEKPIQILKKANLKPGLVRARTIYDRMSLVNDYEENLALATQQFSDLLYSQLTPFHIDKDFTVIKPGQRLPSKSEYLGLFLNEAIAVKKAGLVAIERKKKL